MPKYNHFFPNFAQFQPNLPKSKQVFRKRICWGCGCNSASPAPTTLFLIEKEIVKQLEKRKG